MKEYDRLDYKGKMRSIQVDIYPSKPSVDIKSGSSYYFDDNDILNEQSIAYYKSFSREGLILHKIDSSSTEEEEKVDSVSVDAEDEVETPEDTIVTNESDNDDQEIDDNSDDGINEEETASEPDPVEEITNDESAEEVSEDTNDIDSNELIEYLDLNYDDDSIKKVARESGISRIRGDWDKATIIDKIISSNPDYIINLMKDQ